MTATFHSVRTPLVLPVAGAVTVGLFLLMRQLIDIGPYVPEPVEEMPPLQIRFEVDPVEIEDRVEMTEFTELDPPPRPPSVRA